MSVWIPLWWRGRTLSVACGDSSPEGRALGKKGNSRSHRSTAGRSLPLSCKLYASAKASPFRERWHGEAVTERVNFGTNPFRHFALRNASPPFCRLAATSSPGRGKSFHSGGGLGKEGRSPPHSSTARRSQLISAKLFAPAKASPFRERWHGEAVTERVAYRTHTRKNSPRRLRREFFTANAAYFRYLCTARATMPPRMPETRNSATPWTPTSSTTNIKGLDAPLLATRLCT